MRRFLRWMIILAVLGGLASAATVPLSVWWQKRNIPVYTTAAVSRGKVETVVNSTGTVKPVRSVIVGAFTSGPVADVLVDFNSPVTKGQLLARIDPRLAQASVDRDRAILATQKADLTRVQAQLQQARNNEVRAKKLADVNKDYLSGTEMDQYKFATLVLEAQEQLSEASILQADATLKNSLANLDFTRVISPVDGIVIERKVDPGQTVAASFQTPELFIVAPEMEKHMYVYASVDEADIGLIRTAKELGKPVKFTVDAYPGDLFVGEIYQIRKSATTTQNVVTYPVVIESPNEKLKLMPGMTANISFQIEEKGDVLRVPASALRFVPTAAQVIPEDKHYLDAIIGTPKDGQPTRSAEEKAELAKGRGKRTVWVKEGDLLKAIPVVVGLVESQYAEMLKGDLTDGQLLVTGTETSGATVAK